MAIITASNMQEAIYVEYLGKQYRAVAVWSMADDCLIVTYPWGKEKLRNVTRERAARIMWDEMDLRA